MNKKDEKLLSIGELSKFTGVNVKSLRYYGELGILIPAFVDDSNGYRYYKPYQVHFVEIIQLCVKLGIPLKEFINFIDLNTNTINYENLLEYGANIAKEKIKIINNDLNTINNIKNNIEHCSKFSNKRDFFIRTMPERYCCALKYTGAQSSYANYTNNKEYYETLKHILSYMHKNKLKIGFECGLLYRSTSSLQEKFLFVDVDTTDYQIKNKNNIICIPSGKYICKTSNKSCINNASDIFSEVLNPNNSYIFIETELLPTNINNEPVFELMALIN